ncbi:hypothetical protein HMPREF1624_00094 [Sporothrix schenckii ATCC 58251]|uniref:Uncharacterized protein n=1 Tax=Sporothrix schenckii (strain ATCC 58251 / de Perez 2211183) TaxID=1391915 RepID=U7Q442_SPOS1|nr:hypothetical protein HMPREF1624_00094 [Sporothrix schenckii ATCC 58251]
MYVHFRDLPPVSREHATNSCPVPERLLIYHAGTGRTTFLACLKVTTLFGLAFFTFLVAPAYIAAGKPLWQILGVTICGLVPFAVVLYTSSPFVVFIHLRLPAYARHPDRELLHRFVRNVPAATQLDITTMNLVGRPRLATVAVSDLVPAHERLRIVNFVDTRASSEAAAAGIGSRSPMASSRPLPSNSGQAATTAAAAAPKRPSQFISTSSKFPFVHLAPTTRFGAPAGGNSRGVQYSWAWDDLLALIERRARQPQSKAP